MAETTNSRRAVLANIRLDLDKQRERARQSKPASTRESELVLSQERSVHAGLWLEKYIADLQRENDYSHADLVAGVASLGVPLIYEKHFERWQTYLHEIHAETREFRVKKRMAVGLGDKGVLETSIALHHTYGVPYIPGSALKGLAASYARLIAGEEWQQGREPYRVVFGDTENAGFLTFFDALYIPCSDGNRPLRPDIITVHHPAYYKEKTDQHGNPVAPADWDSPTPIPFLSATGCYLLALAAPDLNKSALWIGRVFELLEQALLVLGIGAKTSSGYGRMENVVRDK